MNRPLACAVAAVLYSAPAAALRLDESGIGQVLLYPYYSTRDAAGGTFNTYLSVVNHSFHAKALRVRFREGRNGRSVASFNLYLSANDTWTAALVPQGSGTRLVTADHSCTDPAIGAGLDFSSAAYSGANFDAAGDGLDRTREGLVEILEMAMLSGPAATGVTQRGTALPADCSATRTVAAADLKAPEGGLLGSLTLINVADGSDYSVNATALADVASRPYFRQPEDPYPSLAADEIDPVSVVAHDRAIYRSVWTRGLDAVNAVLARSYVSAEFVLDAVTRSSTNVVMAFPTRPLASSGNPAPFKNASGYSAGWNSGDPMPILDFSREGPPPRNDNSFGAPQPFEMRSYGAVAVFALDTGAYLDPSVLPFTGSTVNASFPTLHGVFYQNGYFQLAPKGSLVSEPTSSRMDATTGQVRQSRHTYAGLPVIGFMMRSLRNGNLSCPGANVCQGNYGSAFPLRSMRTITAP